ncbi:hypothetical protein SAMN04489835_4293 [Mycolicibacterium rutilum]|uniref:Uncharacterized protein n=1 Tax=Mycolicibacterium rutilum TaxID=370526 RepID=A0A1H6KWJ6_MYCRU|nr:hypothetical protein [Mycolicibacterium rutilum]SEH80028.1 hypothetical protein SAMN04489835_4293 [Mycolicibacterium rutilum]
MFTALVPFVVILFIAMAAASLLAGRGAAPPDSDEADERLATADDILAARAEFDRMMVRKGLVTSRQLELIRYGTRSPAVVTGMRATGQTLEDYREVELDVMVRKPEGGQFPARQTALVPISALAKVAPGSVVDTYYRAGDETAVAVCVAPE